MQYAGLVLTLIAAPADNERGPRYMERALAAIHETDLPPPPITLAYGTVAGQIGLMLHCTQAQRDLVLDPITANYPQCSFTVTDEVERPADSAIWSREVTLRPELFPILRHAQFEDLLNHNFADPVSSLLRAIRPEESIECRMEIRIVPASSRLCHAAVASVRRLDREFFRNYHRLAAFYACHSLRGRWQWLARFWGRLALRSPVPGHTLLETSTSRLHVRVVRCR